MSYCWTVLLVLSSVNLANFSGSGQVSFSLHLVMGLKQLIVPLELLVLIFIDQLGATTELLSIISLQGLQ